MTQKTIAHYLTDLRYDLKDSGALWSDAELTRCVEKAVADLSRFLPDEKTLELTIDSEVSSESFTTPVTSDTDYYVTTWDISAVVDGASATLVKRRPDVPRPVIVTVTDANTSITQLVIIVKGQDTDNKYIEEFFYLENGLVQTGRKYFALVTAIEIDEIAGNGAADTMIVGIGSANGVYVQLANKPIKFQSDSISSRTRDTDYEMDYAGGRIALKSGGGMAANTAYAITYTKSRIEIDLSKYIDDLIRVDRIEYPSGGVPQQFSKLEFWGGILTLAGGYDSQTEVTDKEHLVIRYLAPHCSPNAQSPGSYPDFLDTTVELAASAYALFIKALQYEHQAVTDFASARTAIGSIAAVHELAKAALVLANTQFVASVVASLFTKVDTALDAIATKIGLVDSYLTGATAPSAKKYLDDGDAYIDAVNKGANVAENFASYAMRCTELATALLTEANSYANEASVRLSESDRWVNSGMGWVQLATAYIAEIDRYLDEAGRYHTIAQSNLALAERFKDEAIERRNEAWSIWASPHQIAPLYQLGQRAQLA